METLLDVRMDDQTWNVFGSCHQINQLTTLKGIASRMLGSTPQVGKRGIFSCTPEPHVAFCPIFVHPLFPVFEPHIQKWVIFVRRRPCVCDTFRFKAPPLRGQKIEFDTDSLLLPRADCDN